MDGGPQCSLVSCVSRGRDVCALQRSSQFQVFRRKARGGAAHIEPRGAAEPRNNATDKVLCLLPVKVGSCRAAFSRFFYNVTAGSCSGFIYGGCEANGNNFDSQEECEAACSGVTGSVLPEDSAPAPAQPAAKAPRMAPEGPSESDPSESDPADSAPAHRTEMSAGEFAERCEAAPKTGPCEALLTRWFYNQKTGSCQSFIYGGCRGNKNNYQSEDSCKAACTGSVLPEDSAPAPAQPAAKALRMAPEGPSESDPSESDPSDSAPAQRTEMSAGEFAERCEAATETGPCRAALPRWFYNQKTGSCQSFIYGGCRGNKNNYQSEDSCKATCTGVKVLPSSKKVSAEGEGPASTAHCRLSPDCGPCRAAFTKFYYESDSASCQPFLFGGCRGNANRFDSKEECMRSCGGDGTFDGRGVSRSRWTAAFFLFATLAVISVLLLAALVFTTLRRHRLSRRTSSVSDKEELLPEPDELSSLDSLTLPEEPKPEPKA
ncbi:kunitz-type protease inhibitor 2 [Odontesthes bonariensis]